MSQKSLFFIIATATILACSCLFAADIRTEGVLARLEQTLGVPGDVAVPEVVQLFRDRTISWDLADRCLSAIRTPLAYNELAKIQNEAEGHSSVQRKYPPTHHDAAPDVTTLGRDRHEVKGQ